MFYLRERVIYNINSFTLLSYKYFHGVLLQHPTCTKMTGTLTWAEDFLKPVFSSELHQCKNYKSSKFIYFFFYTIGANNLKLQSQIASDYILLECW